MLENPVASMFSEHLNTTFRVQLAPSHALELELLDVTDASAPSQVRFSILFRGPQEPLLPQRIYPFEHDQLGAFDLFIVPIRRDKNGLYYEAVFNRFI